MIATSMYWRHCRIQDIPCSHQRLPTILWGSLAEANMHARTLWGAGVLDESLPVKKYWRAIQRRHSWGPGERQKFTVFWAGILTLLVSQFLSFQNGEIVTNGVRNLQTLEFCTSVKGTDAKRPSSFFYIQAKQWELQARNMLGTPSCT